MQWSIPSSRWNSPGAVLALAPPGCIDSSKPNRLITPSMSIARTARSLLCLRRKSGIALSLGANSPPRSCWSGVVAATMHRRAEHQSARPQGANPQEEEDVDAGPEVGPGSQEACRRAAATGRLYPRGDGDAEEAELGAPED